MQHNVQQCCQQNTYLDNVGAETETCPVQPDIEVAITIEIIWTKEDMEVANSVDNDENEEDHG